MTNESILISPATESTLLALSAHMGRSPSEILATAVEELRQRLAASTPIDSIPGVNPADVWEAAAQADAGRLVSHADAFARLRSRP